MSIYTRTGDTGETSLFGGVRVPKSDIVVGLYGALDELNSAIGLIISLLAVVEVQEFLWTIQSDILLIGSILAGKPGDFNFVHERVQEMEARIDQMDDSLPKLHQFLLYQGYSRIY